MNYAISPNQMITRGFTLAGIFNVVGMLIISKFFTSPFLSAADPVVFSWFGQVAIVLWGLAYLAVAKNYQHVPYVVIVFFIEKMVYAVTWLLWLLQKGHTLKGMATESLSTAIFFGVYGAGDFIFGLFFGWVALKVLKGRR